MTKTDTERIAELEGKINDKATRMTKILEEYGKLEKEVEGMKKELKTLKEEKTQKETDNANVLTKVETAEQQLEAQILLMEQKLKIK